MTTKTFPRLSVLCLVLGLFGCSTLGIKVPAEADPSTQPFPRLEAGMHTAPIWRIAVDSKDRFLVAASEDKSARVWDVASGKLLTILRPPIGDDNEGKLYAVAISPDGSTIAVGGFTGKADGKDNPIYLFDRASGRLTRRIGGLPEATIHLAFSFDGRLLAASFHGRHGIRVFQLSDGTELWRDSDYKDHTQSIEFYRQEDCWPHPTMARCAFTAPLPSSSFSQKEVRPGEATLLSRASLPTLRSSPWALTIAPKSTSFQATTYAFFMPPIPARLIMVISPKSLGPQTEAGSTPLDDSLNPAYRQSLSGPRLGAARHSSGPQAPTPSRIFVRLPMAVWCLGRHIPLGLSSTPKENVRSVAILPFSIIAAMSPSFAWPKTAAA